MSTHEESRKFDIRLESIEIDLDPDKTLPERWIIKSAAHQLYRLGISLYPNGCTNRPLYYHPIIVFLMPVMLWIRFTYSVIDPGLSTNYWDYLIVGDFGYFMNTRFHLNLTASVVYAMSILSHVLHIVSYLMKREPTYMRVFNMMSGNISPKSIGLTDPLTIKKIMRKTRLALKVAFFLSTFMGAEAFFISFFAFVFTIPFTEFVYIGLPHTLNFAISSTFIFQNLTYHIIYFYIISYYLTAKQKEINSDLRNAIKTKRILNLNHISECLHRIYLEIHEYDSMFWSKFLSVVWLSSSAVIALVIFMFVFGEDKMHLNIRIILFNATFFFSILLLILIETGGSVALEVKKTYKLLASYKFVCMRINQPIIPKTRHAIKVKTIYYNMLFICIFFVLNSF